MSMTTTSHFRPMPMLLVVAIGLALISDPAVAQEMDHSKMNMPMPKPAAKKKPVSAAQEMDHSKMTMPMPKPAVKKKPAAVKKPAARKAEPKPAQVKKRPAAAPKASMDHSSMPMPATDKSMQGMDHSSMPMPADDKSMQGMDHSAMPGMTMAPTEPREPIPVLTAADRAAAVPPAGGHTVHDNSIQSFWLANRLEAWNADPGTGVTWEGQAWIGTDLNRLWLRSEGEQVDGKLESADLEVLYGRSVATWWDVVAGVRHDFKPGAPQDFAAFGVIGYAPYKFEVAATAYLGQGGQTAARLETEYETLITNRLILQPLVELNFYGQNDARRGIGSGFSTLEAGLRLRYEVTRKFAPYIGVVRERAFGRTADLRRMSGADISDTRIVAGLRLWF